MQVRYRKETASRWRDRGGVGRIAGNPDPEPDFECNAFAHDSHPPSLAALKSKSIASGGLCRLERQRNRDKAGNGTERDGGDARGTRQKDAASPQG